MYNIIIKVYICLIAVPPHVDILGMFLTEPWLNSSIFVHLPVNHNFSNTGSPLVPRQCNGHKYLVRIHQGKEVCQHCRKCKPGYGVLTPCSKYNDTECKICEEGFYSSTNSFFHMCMPCAKCSEHEEKIETCTSSRNDKCGKCRKGYYRSTLNAQCQQCVYCAHRNEVVIRNDITECMEYIRNMSPVKNMCKLSHLELHEEFSPTGVQSSKDAKCNLEPTQEFRLVVPKTIEEFSILLFMIGPVIGVVFGALLCILIYYCYHRMRKNKCNQCTCKQDKLASVDLSS